MRLRLTLAAYLAASCAFGQTPALPSGQRWIDHLNNDLLPFWTNAAAYGDPVGAFPGTRCDDQTLYDPKKPCQEIRQNSWISPQQRHLVALSRQTYGYGVAFHLTGNSDYLRVMKAGVDYIRKNAIDRVNGGMGTTQNIGDGSWVPAAPYRNPQELGYGLLGMAFYYYLTRDPDVLTDLTTLKDYIFTNYYNSDLGVMQWMLQSTPDQRYDQQNLVAQLDQMNTYLVLVAPTLPEPWRSDWIGTAVALCWIMQGHFYSWDDQLFFLTANSPSEVKLATAPTDFGHNAKANWMIRWTGMLANQPNWVAFAENNARALFPRAYMKDAGTWAEGLFAGGGLDVDKSWWIFAELDQLAGTLALRDSSFAQYLPSTYAYWFRYFVDPAYGEVWNSVDGKTNQPIRQLPKQWQWKNAYHSFEHAMVGYIVCQQLQGSPVTLYYAFPSDPSTDTIRPYYFYGNVDSIQSSLDSQGTRIVQVQFSGVL